MWDVALKCHNGRKLGLSPPCVPPQSEATHTIFWGHSSGHGGPPTASPPHIPVEPRPTLPIAATPLVRTPPLLTPFLPSPSPSLPHHHPLSSLQSTARCPSGSRGSLSRGPSTPMPCISLGHTGVLPLPPAKALEPSPCQANFAEQALPPSQHTRN